MSEVIWKYPLVITGIQSVSMPLAAKILSVANQDGTMCLWALVNPSCAPQERVIKIVGTGSPMPREPSEFIGTVLHGPHAWHVFESLTPRVIAAVQRLMECLEMVDDSESHRAADEVLCNLLRDVGYEDVVSAFLDVTY